MERLVPEPLTGPPIPGDNAREIREVIRRALIRPAKSAADVSVMSHLSHVLQVASALLAPLALGETEKNRLKLAAALHDIGKAVTDIVGKRWYHADASADLVAHVLSDKVLSDALQEAGCVTELPPEEMELLVRIVREHHSLSARTVFSSPASPLILVADALASSLESGACGSVLQIVSLNSFHASALSYVMANGWAPWARTEVHQLALPKETVSDLVLSEHVIEIVLERAAARGLAPLMRDEGTLWLMGPLADVEALLEESIATEDILGRIDISGIYGRGGWSRLPYLYAITPEYLYTDDATASLAMEDCLRNRKAEIRDQMGSLGLSFDTLTLGRPIESVQSPEQLAEMLYSGIRGFFTSHCPEADEYLPKTADEAASWTQTATNKAFVKAANALHEACPHIPVPALDDVRRLLSRANAARSSFLNVLAARKKALKTLRSRKIRFRLREVAYLDNVPLAEAPPWPNRRDFTGHGVQMPCACCNKRIATTPTSALVSGASEGDGVWASVGRRKRTLICAWCHCAGIADLPVSTLSMYGSCILRESNYLLVRSVLSRRAMVRVLELLGRLSGASLRMAEAEIDEEAAAQDAAAELDDFDRALFSEVLGYVPERTSILGVGGLLGTLASRGMNALMLPGHTPLASRAVFALPSAAFFGAHQARDMNQSVLDLLSGGVIAVLREVLGPSTFSLRATSSRGFVSLSERMVDEDEMRRAKALLAMTEIRRELAQQITGLQDPDRLDIGFVLRLRASERAAVGEMLRDIIRRCRSTNVSALRGRLTINDFVQEICSLTEELSAGSTPTRIEEAGRRIVHALMDAGLVPETTTLFSAAGGGRVAPSSNRRLTGVLAHLWGVFDQAGFDRWLAALRERILLRSTKNASYRLAQVAIAEQVARDYLFETGSDVAEFARRLNEQSLLLILEAARERARARAQAADPPPTLLVPNVVSPVPARPVESAAIAWP